jgi:GNAT superfamily N-acetyltransferase
MLRHMTEDDLAQVREVDLKAFGGKGAATLQPRRREVMAAYLAAGGGLVADAGDAVAGFVFWHRWGSYGWMGPLAVDPLHQGRGLGKSLVETARSALSAGGARVVGLETWPEQGENLTLYSRLSFRWEGFCLLLTRSTLAIDAAIPRSPVDDPALVRRVAAAVLPGFDPYQAVAAFVHQGLGDLFAAANGFVLCQRGGSREGTDGLGLVRLLLVEPGARRNVTERLLETACAYFRAVGAREVVLPLYADQQYWLPGLLAGGWRIAGATLRAFWPAPPPAPRGTAFYNLVG